MASRSLPRSTPSTALDAVDASALLAWLRAETEGMVDLLARLAEAESPSLEPGLQRAPFALLAAELEELGHLVRAVPGDGTGAHLYARPARRRHGAPWQLLIGHMDTVWPAGTLASMPVRRDGDLLYGPGVVDMKGGLVQIVYALRALDELGLRPQVTPVVLVVADEEIGSISSRRTLIRLARGAARAFVLEAAFGPSGMLKTARKGVGHFTVRVRGRAAHAGVAPERGLSAILELSHQVQRLFALNDPGRGVTVNVGTIDGGLRPNVIAPAAVAEVDVRVPTHESAHEVEAAIRALTPVAEGVELEVTGGIGRPPLEPTARNLALWHLAQRLGARLGLPLEAAAVGGASDGNYTSLHTATLDGLGPVGEGAHAHDEHIVVPRLPERTALLALLLLAPPELP